MAAKKVVSKKTTSKSAQGAKTPIKRKVAPKKPAMQSFQRAEEAEPFMTFKITRQTIYWIIIAAISVAFVVWIYRLQSDINDLYSQVDRLRAESAELDAMKSSTTEGTPQVEQN